MNNARRKRIKNAIELIEKLKSDIESIVEELEDIRNDEHDAYDNMPESLQDSDRGCTMSECIDNLEEAIGTLDDIDLEYDVISPLEDCL